MNIAVGTSKISEAARVIIAQAGGRIEPSKKEGVSIVTLPHGGELSCNGMHVYIDVHPDIETVLHFFRAWNTEDCSLDICK